MIMMLNRVTYSFHRLKHPIYHAIIAILLLRPTVAHSILIQINAGTPPKVQFRPAAQITRCLTPAPLCTYGCGCGDGDGAGVLLKRRRPNRMMAQYLIVLDGLHGYGVEMLWPRCIPFHSRLRD